MSLKINEEFAKKFNKKKDCQELQKLKLKYDDEEDESDTSDAESEDEVAQIITNKFEKDFFKTLNAIRKKDPKIYDPNVEFFDDCEQEDLKQPKKKTKSLKVRNYEGAHILEMEGRQEEAEDESLIKFEEDIIPKDNEEKELAKCFLDILKKGKKENSSATIIKEEDIKETVPIKQESNEDIYENMDGENDNTEDSKESTDSKDKFLIDYFKKKKYLFESGAAEDDLDDASNDEKEFEKLEEFEHKYNFRFEDPDEDFIKSYPRTIVDSMRIKANKRAEKRKEVEARKKQEKAKKKEELRTLRKLKKKEEMKKLKKLKKISGVEMKLEDINLEEEFDPIKYDEMMKKHFGKNYYDEYDNEDVTQIDEQILDEGETEDWDNWTGNQTEEFETNHANKEESGEGQERTRRSKKSRKEKESKKLKKSKFTEMMEKNRSKPLFDPTKETFEEYLDKHYNLDFEDLIDGETCRFRYKKVFAADYGLSTDEVLAAPEQELNAWVSLKKMNELKTEEEEALYERGIKQKMRKKKKILKSLYEKPENGEPSEDKTDDNAIENRQSVNHKNSTAKGKKRKRHEEGLSEDRLEGYNINPKKFKYMYLPMLKDDEKNSKTKN